MIPAQCSQNINFWHLIFDIKLQEMYMLQYLLWGYEVIQWKQAFWTYSSMPSILPSWSAPICVHFGPYSSKPFLSKFIQIYFKHHNCTRSTTSSTSSFNTFTNSVKNLLFMITLNLCTLILEPLVLLPYAGKKDYDFQG